jgi:hypothetical protein
MISRTTIGGCYRQAQGLSVDATADPAASQSVDGKAVLRSLCGLSIGVRIMALRIAVGASRSGLAKASGPSPRCFRASSAGRIRSLRRLVSASP